MPRIGFWVAGISGHLWPPTRRPPPRDRQASAVPRCPEHKRLGEHGIAPCGTLKLPPNEKSFAHRFLSRCSPPVSFALWRILFLHERLFAFSRNSVFCFRSTPECLQHRVTAGYPLSLECQDDDSNSASYTIYLSHKTELAKFITADWNWEALPHGDDSFLVEFPSEDQLKRRVDIDFCLKNHGVTLTISEWQDASDSIPAYHLDEVWVHVSKVPHPWCHYLGFWALGTVIGATLEVDMPTYRKKGVIRIRVGMMNREYLPFTTDVVFGKIGHEVTFSLEEANFEPAIPPPNPDYSDRDEDAAGKDDANHGRDGGQAQKKQKTIENTSSSSNAPTGGGPVPMRLATAMSLLEKKGLGKLSQLLSLDDIAKLPAVYVTPPAKNVKGNACSGKSLHPPEKATSGERTSTEPSLEATERSLVAGTHTLPSDQSHSPRLSKKVTPTQPMPTLPRPKVGTNNRSTSPIPMLCEIDSSVRPEIPHSSSSALTIRQTVKPAKLGDLLMSRLMTPRPSASSKLGKDVPANINDGPGLQSPLADEDMTSKAMQRAAIRNLDSPPEKKSAAAQSVVPHSPSSPSIPQPGSRAASELEGTRLVTCESFLGSYIGVESSGTGRHVFGNLRELLRIIQSDEYVCR